MTAELYQTLQEIKQRLIVIEEHLLIDTEDPFLQAKQHQSQIATLLMVIRGHAPSLSKETIVKEAEKKGVDQKTTLYCLELLRKTGEIFEPKGGFVQRI